LIPAIDLRGGKCVRLRQGDYAQETVFDDDPGAVAGRWSEAGAAVIHVVDLDGAAAGRPANLDALRGIRGATSATLQYGGGVRAAAFEVIASGGVAEIEDVLAIRSTGAAAAIVGQALYTGRIDLGAALERLAKAED